MLVSAVLISLRNFVTLYSLRSRRVFTLLGIHLQKVMSKRSPAPFEQQRVSVPIEEQEQMCLSVCAIRCREFFGAFYD